LTLFGKLNYVADSRDEEQEARLSVGQPTVLPHTTFGVTWRHWSRDHLIPHMPFPIGGPLEPSLYL